MKKLIVAIMALCTVVLAGCKTVPTPDTMETTAKSIGIAAGYVANQTKIDDKSRAAVIQIINEVAKATPASGQSFESAWMPIAEAEIAKLVAAGKLDESQAAIVKIAFDVAAKGIDYIFDVRYPKARTYAELVNAAIRGFTDGFLTVFTPADSMKAAKLPYDEAAYKYLSNLKK